MTTIQLKSNFHKLIEDISNEKLLEKFYEIMTTANSTKEGKFWESLSEEQKAEIVNIDIENNDENNLIGEEEIKKKYAKWF